MKAGFFETRREQIEKDILPCVRKAKTRSELLRELKSCAMVGACEERSRTLEIIRNSDTDRFTKQALIDAVIGKGVLEVLGWETKSSAGTVRRGTADKFVRAAGKTGWTPGTGMFEPRPCSILGRG